MKNNKTHTKQFFTLRNKLTTLILVAVVPSFLIALNLLFAFISYRNSYDSIIANMTTANTYNMNFKEEMDETLYRMVARDIMAEDIEKEEVRNPYVMIEDIREASQKLMRISTEPESRSWLLRLGRNIDTLEDRVNDINENIRIGDRYDENIEMLENVYTLTALVQDDIQYYIYYQTRNIEQLKTQLNLEISRFMVMISIVMVIFLFTVMLVALMVTRGITKPVEDLVHVTEKISLGDFSARSDVDTGDEIETLSEAVNEMTENLEEMVTTIKEDERRMRNTELRLLQEQINPHFLYNTLDTIVWLIESNRAEEAEDMVISLSSFFRLVLSHGLEYITIAEEERHIKSYLEIQQVRYKDILQYDIDIDKELYMYKILKLTLQPLVENALYHGIKYKRAMGVITVRGHEMDDNIVLTVSDDGVGMDEETLKNLQEEIKKSCQETSKGFGLANVNERIRMTFGPEYGITIDSKKGAGTIVTVRIPKRTPDEEEKRGN